MDIKPGDWVITDQNTYHINKPCTCEDKKYIGKFISMREENFKNYGDVKYFYSFCQHGLQEIPNSDTRGWEWLNIDKLKLWI